MTVGEDINSDHFPNRHKTPPRGLFFYDMIRETNEPMISSTTPDKLAEIIRDTWPGLYRIPQVSYNNQKTSKNEKV